jgi:hypothetical protein
MGPLAPGTEFAGHRIESLVGRGGMGVVYRARHLELDRVVALKVIAPELLEDPRIRERFVREARTAASIAHPIPAGAAGRSTRRRSGSTAARSLRTEPGRDSSRRAASLPAGSCRSA